MCRDPGTPLHGNRDTERFEYGAVVKFTCDPGYTIVGSDTISCDQNEDRGIWSGQKPTCERKFKVYSSFYFLINRDFR